MSNNPPTDSPSSLPANSPSGSPANPPIHAASGERFFDLLDRLREGGASTDDVLMALLPLMRQVQQTHELGQVAPLAGLEALQVQDTHLYYVVMAAQIPRRQVARIDALQRPVSLAVEVRGERHLEADMDHGGLEFRAAEVHDSEAPPGRLVYVPGYLAWEHLLDHHDALTDIFSLGMIAASLAFGLDFRDARDLSAFVLRRGNLFEFNPSLHPVLVTAIIRMTELNRHRRAQDLGALIVALENYRDQDMAEGAVDFARLKGFRKATLDGRRDVVLNHLRERLFEISRRNRLIYFKSSMQTLNLTEGSVPLLFDYRNIRPEQLLYWQPGVARTLARGAELNLGKYLRYEDAPYLAGILDRIRQEAGRDRQEYGFSQLKLALVFLRWHNIKEAPQERIHSPLLLLPVELDKRKGINDRHVLTPTSNEAEVNPALSHYLHQLYGLRLPEAIDLEETSLDAFADFVEQQIKISAPEITLKRIDKPQIDLIHESAQRQLDNYRRRTGNRLTGRGARRYDAAIDYSYSAQNFQPLGLQLFLHRVRPSPSPLRGALDEKPRPRHPFMAPSEAMPAEASDVSGAADANSRKSGKTMYSLRQGSDDNRFVWDFDMCSLTLGNFNYRKMSLVRDYARIIESDLENPAYDDIFTFDAKDLEPLPTGVMDPADLHLVVPCDPTQAGAVQSAREGKCYIIQGPPGTGKSQTITNLIADFVARGKRVLFVCEKRVAIDVVYNRLKHQGLDRLCCLIHDSQADKKSFVMDLKASYEGFLAEDDDPRLVARHRDTITRMHADLQVLEHFSAGMSGPVNGAEITLRGLLHRLVELREHVVELTADQRELLPTYADWERDGRLVRQLGRTLVELGEAPIFADQPLAQLNGAILQDAAPLNTLRRRLEAARRGLAELRAHLDRSSLALDEGASLGSVLDLAAYADLLRPLAECHLVDVLDENSRSAREFDAQGRDLDAKVVAWEKAAAVNANWRTKLAPGDVETALLQATATENGLLRFLNPTWWKLRKVMLAHYNFAAHAIAPPWTQVLGQLQAEQRAADVLAEAQRLAADHLGVSSVAETRALVQRLRQQVATLPPALREVHEFVRQQADPGAMVRQMLDLRDAALTLQRELEAFLEQPRERPLLALGGLLDRIDEATRLLPELLPWLLEALDASAATRAMLRDLPLDADGFEAAIAAATLDAAIRQDSSLKRLTGPNLEHRMVRLAEAWQEWMQLNAHVIVQGVRQRFREHVTLTAAPLGQLNPNEREFKKAYSAGRRELEHEFGKVMRYKSIRALTDGPAGAVIRDLKPVWLMSPLSVADTIPLQEAGFDVVIFDEASQIKLEEAVPAIFRARQVIVVGDEMQLPPSNFFAAARGADDDTLVFQEGGQRVEYDLNVDSLLSHAANNLPSTLLGWHYRSRHEALIGFSNNAFYSGHLLTVPDRHLAPDDLDEIRVDFAAEGEENVDEVLRRSISYHYLETGVYDKTRNPSEAAYIAQMVRELLRRDTGLSIGIVAFSEAQQGEIEGALNELANEDTEFRNRLDAEYDREVEGEFVGLFIKNLENVQGDERDLIILSICYGHGPSGRMFMNFGPINMNGGEKRLNVIFSRAKRHMAVVASIRHHHITNDYNDGAHCLQQFLDYAWSISAGDVVAARRVLAGMAPRRSAIETRAVASAAAGSGDATRDSVITGLADACRARGWIVGLGVGESDFRCDVALRTAGHSSWQLGLVVDTDAHYRNPDLVERYLVRPGVLRSFGWSPLHVLGKDWLENADDLLDQIERRLTGAEQAPVPQAATIPPPAMVRPKSDDATGESADLASAAATVENDPSVVPARPVLVGSLTAGEDIDEANEDTSANAATSPGGPEPAPAAAVALALQCRLEYTGDGSSKYWEIAVAGVGVTVRYGRIGTAGQSATKQYDTATRARLDAEKQIAAKLRKGYVRVGEGA